MLSIVKDVPPFQRYHREKEAINIPMVVEFNL